ncbi:DUF7344 domain-containing protein [Haloarchaeobius litoreus]|uniref:ArsR family transcriptional regulator n=1 Tax=Haloarchaeobius litoreus TaxID=755306 RepID=A0ABD6DKJ2_9EURY|nr:hypothetical protein [Haloarchaeobius litoreus]
MPRNHSDSTESDARGETKAAGLADDQLYRGLAAAERRRVLYSLLTEGPATVDELATLLTGWRATDIGRMMTPDDRDRLLTELVHIHLPLLEDAGLVVRNDDTESVELGTLDPTVRKLVRESIAAEPTPRG